ncbi:xanthine phosphoribosyltransferase [Anaerotignum sp.]|uniref:xanthine phosphoribosyltransferase n=1 Tax=Anaerotignum sp. TaxID=2039241 RepID=UPI0027151FDC|nr:xanthine phosphoribosyltransferase [Anaerotignum sp.]
MELLKRRIKNDGTEIGTEIVKVDSFLNHQLDIGLFMALGKEIHRRFGNMGINKILTIEASGIGIAAITAIYFDLVPVVFAKKTQPNTMTEDYYGAPVKSFTKGTVSMARVSKKYLDKDDKVLILDDFLAHGEAAAGLANLVEQAGGTVCGIAAIVEKEFQGGSQKLRDLGYHVDSLAVITKIEDGKIYFKD